MKFTCTEEARDYLEVTQQNFDGELRVAVYNHYECCKELSVFLNPKQVEELVEFLQGYLAAHNPKVDGEE